MKNSRSVGLYGEEWYQLKGSFCNRFSTKLDHNTGIGRMFVFRSIGRRVFPTL